MYNGKESEPFKKHVNHVFFVCCGVMMKGITPCLSLNLSSLSGLLLIIALSGYCLSSGKWKDLVPFVKGSMTLVGGFLLFLFQYEYCLNPVLHFHQFVEFLLIALNCWNNPVSQVTKTLDKAGYFIGTSLWFIASVDTTNHIYQFSTVLVHLTWIRMLTCLVAITVLVMYVIGEVAYEINGTPSPSLKCLEWIIFTHGLKNSILLLQDLDFPFLALCYPSVNVVLKLFTMSIFILELKYLKDVLTKSDLKGRFIVEI
jgi:hypothetical protein